MDKVKGMKAFAPLALSAGSVMTNGRCVWSTDLIYITCIMYSIWDISFPGWRCRLTHTVISTVFEAAVIRGLQRRCGNKRM